MRVVVSYDISCDKRRKKVSDLLEMILPRVQLSVFEGEVPAEPLKKTLEKALVHLEAETDSLRVYHLCASCAPKVEVFGKKLLTDVPPVRIL